MQVSCRLAAAWSLRASVDLRSRAGQELQQALDIDADQPTGQFRAAILLLAREHLTEALPHLEKATQWDPLSPPFQCTRAQVLDELGQTTKALAILSREEAVLPDDPYAFYVQALILMQHGQYQEAKAAAKHALTIQADFEPAKSLIQNPLLPK